MSTEVDAPSTEELALVARHGSSALVKGVAIAELAKRQDRLDELEAMLEDGGVPDG